MFCQVRSRCLVAPGRGLGGIPLVAPWWRRAVGHALAAGCWRWRVRHSGRSFSGVVLVAGFASCGAAVAFAGAWGGWCGCAVALRRRVSAGRVLWVVSVPVAYPGSAQAVPAGGGSVWWVSRG